MRVRPVGDRGDVALRSPRPDGATGIGTTSASACGDGASSSPPSLHGSSSGAERNRRASTAPLPDPVATRAIARAGASKRIAPGTGASSAAVVDE